MYFKPEELYVMIKNPATGFKVYVPRIYNSRKKIFVVIKRFRFSTATKAVDKSREIQNRINKIYGILR